MKPLYFFAAAAAAVGLSTAAQANVIYNNGGPNQSSGNETVAWIQAEDFTFASNTLVGGAGVYIGSTGGSLASWDGNFQYSIYGDAGGTPGAQLAGGAVSVSPVNSGTPWCCSGNAYLYQFDFNSAFAATGGATYWLGIHAGAVGNFNRNELYFVTTEANGTNTGHESQGGTLNNWTGNDQEHAFFLTDATAAPEPASWALMILGFGGAGVALRRRRQTAVTA